MNPIHHAARNGNLNEVMRLLKDDPQAAHYVSGSGGGCTALHYAAMNGHIEVAACLVEHGANINLPTRYNRNRTALFLACRDGNLGLVELLLDKGADASTHDNEGFTALMMASICGHAEVAQRLLSCGHPAIDVDARSFGGKTALWYACSTRQSEVVRVLLQSGADPTIGSDQGSTPLHVAKQYKDPQAAIYLQEWQRSYVLTQARHLHDANHPDDHDRGHGRDQALPCYLEGRALRGEALPQVQVLAKEKRGSGGDEVVGAVVEYFVCGGMKKDLFVELMELMGRTGVREEEEDETN